MAWKIANDSCHPDVFCAPGNAGTAQIATNLGIGAEDVEALTDWAVQNRPDLVVVGPEAPLCAGLADRMAAEGLKVFGPCRAAAEMEGSKVFAKDIMAAAGVPTARAASFAESQAAIDYLAEVGAPVVIKADGLAAGKGVTVCESVEQAEQAIREAMDERAFGESGARVLVEECLVGEEASILALVDGENIVMLASSQDHKRAFNDDLGPNTGGMGAYSPAPVVTDELLPVIRAQVLEPTVAELRKRGITYKGVLYAGLMVADGEIKVLEFNCRFGDPETQAVLARIDGDLLPALVACVDGTLSEDLIGWKPEASVCVVMASGGYPASYEKGKEIRGLDEANALEGVVVFHAGTKLVDGVNVSWGGRVLGVTALGEELPEAIHRAYQAVSRISFDQAQYRTDIGAKGVLSG